MAAIGARPTLAAVATAAGVSKATVSKVLNGRPDVSPRTREQVGAVIHALGYVPSTGRRLGQTPTTVTIVFHAFNLYSCHVLAGLVAAASELDVDVVVADPAADGEPAPMTGPWFRARADAGHVGVIVVATVLSAVQIEACAAVGLRLVAIDPVSVDPDSVKDVVSVSATNWSGGVQATEYLLGLGHRRIGFAGGLPASVPARGRLHGYLAALENHDVKPDRRSLVLQHSFTYEGGHEMGMRFLRSPRPPTAVVAACDASALGVMAAARSLGMRLPEDLSIVGFDDIYAAEWTAPRLTTVRQPIREMGRLALRTLVALGRGVQPETHHFELATTLVVRDSAAPPHG